MATTEKLGGMYSGLRVSKHSDYFSFTNLEYGMLCRIYFRDVDKYIANPNIKHWGDNSYSNDVYDVDRDLIVKYLKKSRCRYETVTDVMNSRSKLKEKYLKQFSVRELLDYYKERKGKANEVESRSKNGTLSR